DLLRQPLALLGGWRGQRGQNRTLGGFRWLILKRGERRQTTTPRRVPAQALLRLGTHGPADETEGQQDGDARICRFHCKNGLEHDSCHRFPRVVATVPQEDASTRGASQKISQVTTLPFRS